MTIKYLLCMNIKFRGNRIYSYGHVISRYQCIIKMYQKRQGISVLLYSLQSLQSSFTLDFLLKQKNKPINFFFLPNPWNCCPGFLSVFKRLSWIFSQKKHCFCFKNIFSQFLELFLTRKFNRCLLIF